MFVDASYLLQEGGSLCLGTKRRSEISCDYGTLVAALVDKVEAHGQLPVLRLYWYDAARSGAPARDHLAIAELRNVKLRLGRLVEREGRLEQKGVDSLIVRDLMTLARERAVASAYLVAGDDDLREGVVAAQDMGVRVIVVGIPAEEGNVALTLLHEADDYAELSQAFLAPHLARVQPATADGASPALVAADIGRGYAMACAESLSRDQLAALLADYPRIPSDLDAPLLRDAERALGDLRDRFELKRELRAGFWEGIQQAVAGGPPG